MKTTYVVIVKNGARIVIIKSNEIIINKEQVSEDFFKSAKKVTQDFVNKGYEIAITDDFLQKTDKSSHDLIDGGNMFFVDSEEEAINRLKPMSEKEKMLAGELYNCGDPELMELWTLGKNLMKRYNNLDYSDRTEQQKILDRLLGARGKHTQITAPFFVDYGKFIHLGNNCEINMNCVFLDCNRITIGDNALIAPGVHIYTVTHPISASERFHKSINKGFPFAVCKTAPVTIGDNVWIGGGSIILPGVTIGDNVTIGAGSVVTKSIPANVLAFGNPCKIIRKI
jgi:maltose O-acetyltransferase